MTIPKNTVTDRLAVSDRQLRFWRKTGLVVPAAAENPRPEAKQRLLPAYFYSPDQFAQISVVAALKRKGMGLPIVRDVFPYLVDALHQRPPYLIVTRDNAWPCKSEFEAIRVLARLRGTAYLVEPEYWSHG